MLHSIFVWLRCLYWIAVVIFASYLFVGSKDWGTALSFGVGAALFYIPCAFVAAFSEVLFVKPEAKAPKAHHVMDYVAEKHSGYIDRYSTKTGKGTIIDKNGRSHAFVLSSFLADTPIMFGRYVLFEMRQHFSDPEDTVERFCYDPDRFFEYHVSKKQYLTGKKLRCYNCGQVIHPYTDSSGRFCRLCGAQFKLPQYTDFN